MLKQNQHPEVKKYVRKHELNIKRDSTEKIKTWIYEYYEFKKKLDEFIKRSDIRQFFST